jgi:hypothetical protein
MKCPYRIANIHSITHRNGERAPLRDRGRDGRLEKVHRGALRWPLRLRGLFVNTTRGLAGGQWSRKRFEKKVFEVDQRILPRPWRIPGIRCFEVVWNRLNGGIAVINAAPPYHGSPGRPQAQRGLHRVYLVFSCWRTFSTSHTSACRGHDVDSRWMEGILTLTLNSFSEALLGYNQQVCTLLFSLYTPTPTDKRDALSPMMRTW